MSIGNQLGNVVGLSLLLGLGPVMSTLGQDQPAAPPPVSDALPAVVPTKGLGQHPVSAEGKIPDQPPVKKPLAVPQASLPVEPSPAGAPGATTEQPVSVPAEETAAPVAPPANPYLIIPERNPFRLVPEPEPVPEVTNEPPPPPPPPPIQVKLSGVTDMIGGRKMAILILTEQPQAGKGLPGPPDTKFLYENESYKGVKVVSIDLKKHSVLVDNHGQVTNVVFGKMEASSVAAAPAPGGVPGQPGVRPGMPGAPGAVIRPPTTQPQAGQPNNAAVDNAGGSSVIVGGNDYDNTARNTRGGVFVSGANNTSTTLGGAGTGTSVGSGIPNTGSAVSNPSVPTRPTRTPSKQPLFTPPEPPALPPWPIQ